MSNLVEVNEKNFKSEVLEAEGPVLVDFGAVWCGPCKMLDPLVEEMAEDWGESVKVVKLDIDNNVNVAMSFQVMSVPTLMLFKDGEPVERMTGFKPKNKILEKLNPHL
ncbi:MAG: thioredoxin [Chloroflexi bacterium]|nr:thioredoxin [Chloroflexota bacterium]MBT4004288.1 thioredoxin [Chloroflexota bacterium]MBT4305715.1 thioredoxin [Chloroflexota bacterium]MBT4533539.1 thioredoxin [Chloroflexota bacterium]MBT4681818.1 thioredoxin [Chloroflexota bacterium]